MSHLVAVLVVVIVLVATACSADVTDSDEYRSLEAELATVTEAHEAVASELEEAKQDLDEAKGEADQARDETYEAVAEAQAAQFEIDAATARALEAEAALAEAAYVEWPESLRSEFIVGCAEEAGTGDQSSDMAICSCVMDHLENSYPLVDFLTMAVEMADSELGQFGFPTEMDPEFAGVVATAAASCLVDPSVAFVTGKSKSINDIATGDCFDDPVGAVEDTDLVVVHPCSDPHDNEVYATLEMPGEDWPGEDAVNRWADTHCLDAFAPYVGTRYESSVLEIGWYYPVEESWVKWDNRKISCLLYDPSLEKLSRSMNGSVA